MRQLLPFPILLILLLVFHREAAAGTAQGLLLWYQTLIPALLPFILVTNALSETNAWQAAAQAMQRLDFSRGCELMILLLGNLCGYPIGGKLINDFACCGYLSARRANLLLPLASQASPMFILGYIHLHILKRQLPLSILLLSIYLPVLLRYLAIGAPEPGQEQAAPGQAGTIPLRDTFLHAVRIMVMIGVYVIMFSILLKILIPRLSSPVWQSLLAFLEITTGLKVLSGIALPETLRIGLICALTAFGGLCSAFQTLGVIRHSGISIKKYLPEKLLLSAGTFLLVLCYLYTV